jgi:hypothetical protein
MEILRLKSSVTKIRKLHYRLKSRYGQTEESTNLKKSQ